MTQLGTITDPQFVAKADYRAWERFTLRFIRDERDLPFIPLILKITAFMLPAGLLLFVPGLPSWLWYSLAVIYLYLNNLYFKGPFGLMMHCTSHRPFFKKEYDWLNKYIPWFLAPFFGHTPETYFAHHIGMHHAENNLEEDISSTMEYRRDSFKEFMRYFSNFFFKGIFQLYGYHKDKKTWPFFLPRIVLGELSFYLLCVVLAIVNFPATLVVFILPFLIFRFITMMGNWSQHAFVDPDDPTNLYKSSITCINVKYNHKCWNDGYHISHHLRPSMHWTLHPKHFLDNIEEYRKNDALVFDGLDFLQVFVKLMKKKYDELADHVVDLGNYNSHEEVVAMLKKRTLFIPFSTVETSQAPEPVAEGQA